MIEHIVPYISILITSITILILIWSLTEPHLLDVTTIILPQNDKKPADQASALNVILISDLHTEYIFIRPERVMREIEQFNPDVILFAGDWCAGRTTRSINKMELWLDRLSYTADKLKIPLLAVPGNHDNSDILEKVRESSCRLISDTDHIVADCLGRDWQITGIADYHNPQKAFAGKESRVPFSRHVVLAHNPDAVLSLEKNQGRFFLCGHFHGGQIWAPLNLEFQILRDEKMAAMGYHRGAFKLSSHWCYISRGLGCVLLPLRFLSRPELTKLTLTADDEMPDPYNKRGES